MEYTVTLYSDTILQDYVWYCTVVDEGPVGDLSSESISTHFQGLLTIVQLAATRWSDQIWISCWILPHFDIRTISVAWKLKELQIFFVLLTKNIWWHLAW